MSISIGDLCNKLPEPGWPREHLDNDWNGQISPEELTALGLEKAEVEELFDSLGFSALPRDRLDTLYLSQYARYVDTTRNLIEFGDLPGARAAYARALSIAHYYGLSVNSNFFTILLENHLGTAEESFDRAAIFLENNPTDDEGMFKAALAGLQALAAEGYLSSEQQQAIPALVQRGHAAWYDYYLAQAEEKNRRDLELGYGSRVVETRTLLSEAQTAAKAGGLVGNPERESALEANIDEAFRRGEERAYKAFLAEAANAETPPSRALQALKYAGMVREDAGISLLVHGQTVTEILAARPLSADTQQTGPVAQGRLPGEDALR